MCLLGNVQMCISDAATSALFYSLRDNQGSWVDFCVGCAAKCMCITTKGTSRIHTPFVEVMATEGRVIIDPGF